MKENEKFEQYKNLMYLALDDSNGVFEICSKVIISMSITNHHTEKQFKEILDYMLTAFNEAPSMEQTMAMVFAERFGDED